MATGNTRCSNINAQKHETIEQNIEGAFAVVAPTKLLGDMLCPTPDFGAYGLVLRLGGI